MAKRDIKAKRWERRRRRKVWNAILRAQRNKAFAAGRMWGKATMQEIWLREFCCVLQNPEINRRATMALDAITGKAGVVDGRRAEDTLYFPEQVRILGDGTVQYRWGFYANTFSWKRYKSSLRNEAWRNR